MKPGEQLRGGTLADITERLQRFREERGWEKDHTPTNLAVSIAIETGELLLAPAGLDYLASSSDDLTQLRLYAKQRAVKWPTGERP